MGTQHPKEVYESLNDSTSVIVWCVISRNEVIGPYFFSTENVIGSAYKRMVCYILFPRLQGYTEDKIFQRDEARPHNSLELREYMERKLPNRWMQRGSPIEWLSRSTDLTPCD